MISHFYRFIFVHINKTGGTSIEKLFDFAADQRDVVDKHPPIYYYQKHFPQAFQDYFKFAFVRNPWDWLVSRYHWSKDKQHLFDYSFDDFLLRLKNNQDLSDAAPWLKYALKPQLERLQIADQLAVDFVGKFESLQADFNHICERLDLMAIPLPHVFATRRGSYTDYYRPETRDWVASLYSQDIEAFGYRFEPAPMIPVNMDLSQGQPEANAIDTLRIFWPEKPMSLFDQLALASFAMSGHRVEVYSYGIIPKIPGIVWCNAAEIISEAEALQAFADARTQQGFIERFALTLLFEKGGIWVDSDLICLKSLRDLPQDCLLINQQEQVRYRFLRFSAQHPLIQVLLTACQSDELLTSLNSLLSDWREQIVMIAEADFFALSADTIWQIFDPEHLKQCQQAVQAGFALRSYKETWQDLGMSLQKLPPQGAFLNLLARQILPDKKFDSYSALELKNRLDPWLQNWHKKRYFALSSFPFAQGAPISYPEFDPEEYPLRRRLIVWPAMLNKYDGSNINGPSLMRVPDWLPQPLGKYYLYFAHHKGRYIRLAFADHLAGPWRIYQPGTLQLAQTHCLQADQARIQAHIASPDVFVDHERQEIRMYFHGHVSEHSSSKLFAQRSFVAISKDGLIFKSLTQELGNPYFRVFVWRNQFYALAMPGQFYRSDDGLHDFVPGPAPFETRMRHCALKVIGNQLWIFYSRIGDRPESILFSRVDLTQPFEKWTPTAAICVLKPQIDWEGCDFPVLPSERGPVYMPVKQLRDPYFFSEDNRFYIVYTVAGEWGLAISEFVIKQKSSGNL